MKPQRCLLTQSILRARGFADACDARRKSANTMLVYNVQWKVVQSSHRKGTQTACFTSGECGGIYFFYTCPLNFFLFEFLMEGVFCFLNICVYYINICIFTRCVWKYVSCHASIVQFVGTDQGDVSLSSINPGEPQRQTALEAAVQLHAARAFHAQRAYAATVFEANARTEMRDEAEAAAREDGNTVTGVVKELRDFMSQVLQAV